MQRGKGQKCLAVENFTFSYSVTSGVLSVQWVLVPTFFMIIFISPNYTGLK